MNSMLCNNVGKAFLRMVFVSVRSVSSFGASESQAEGSDLNAQLSVTVPYSTSIEAFDGSELTVEELEEFNEKTGRYIYGKCDGETAILIDEEITERTWVKSEVRYSVVFMRNTEGTWTEVHRGTYVGSDGGGFARNTYKENGWRTDLEFVAIDRPVPQDRTKSGYYNRVIRAYNEYILNVPQYEGCSLKEYVDIFNEWTDKRISPFPSYGLIDVNSDGIPELGEIIPLSGYALYGYIDGTVVPLETAGGNGQHGPVGIRTNGYTYQEHISTGAYWIFVNYNKDLSANYLEFGTFREPPYSSEGEYMGVSYYSGYKHLEGDDILKHSIGYKYASQVFYFDGEVVSEREYCQLTRPYMNMLRSGIRYPYSPVKLADKHLAAFVKREYPQYFSE
ncbi:MAG: hypothetical protein J5933_05910 [Clostridia bacterium]|nr:hypothetical protein [Clostridia bacterium]